MAAWITACLLFAFYLLAVPVELAVKIRTKPEISVGTGVAIFEGRLALRKAEKRIKEVKGGDFLQKFSFGSGKNFLFRPLKYMIRHLKIESLMLTGRIGMEDAAATALVCGGCEAVKSAIMPFGWSRRILIAVEPDFSGSGSSIAFSGMVSMRAGHIICTALIGAVTWIKGRISLWKSTRLKIS